MQRHAPQQAAPSGGGTTAPPPKPLESLGAQRRRAATVLQAAQRGKLVRSGPPGVQGHRSQPVARDGTQQLQEQLYAAADSHAAAAAASFASSPSSSAAAAAMAFSPASNSVRERHGGCGLRTVSATSSHGDGARQTSSHEQEGDYAEAAVAVDRGPKDDADVAAAAHPPLSSAYAHRDDEEARVREAERPGGLFGFLAAFFRCVPSPADAEYAGRLAAEDRLQLEGRRERAAVMIQRRYRGRSKQLQLKVRVHLSRLPQGQAARACAGGLESIADLVCDTLGTNVWARALHNAPDDWEEEDMYNAMMNLLCRPVRSKYAWLLAQPTPIERMLLDKLRKKLVDEYGEPAPPPKKPEEPSPESAHQR